MSRGKFERRKRRPSFLYYLTLTVLILIFAGSVWYLADYYIGSAQQAGEYEDLAALVEAARGTAPTVSRDQRPDAPTHADGTPIPTDGDFPMLPPAQVADIHDENGILREYAPLYEINPDMAGWLEIPGTRISYPVMHTPGRPDHYLHRNFNDEYNSWGCIYAREECDLVTPSDNITIYGHHMKDGSMFAGLNAYISREFWEENPYIRFDTLTEHHTYAIFAVFRTTASEGEGFAYHDFINAEDEMAFDTFIAKCLSLSLYGTDLVPTYGDKIICLSTCEYSQTNGRLVIAAMRIS